MHLQYQTKENLVLKILLGTFVCVCAYEYRFPWGQKRVSDPQEQEWQPVVSQPTWMPGIDLESSAKAVYTLNHWAISTAKKRIEVENTAWVTKSCICDVKTSQAFNKLLTAVLPLDKLEIEGNIQD